MKKLILILALLLLPAFSSAATLSLVGTPQEVGAGDLLLVQARVDSDFSVNVFSGTLRYPAALLEPVDVRDGSSIVTAWLRRPDTASSGEIRFEGITAGGFSGRRGELFGVVFRVKGAGAAAVSLGEVRVLRNDGVGSEEETALRPLTLALGAEARGGFVAAEDTDPPEPMTIYLGDDPALFVFRSYVVFSPQDKGSGVASVEVRERRAFWWGGEWQEAESPYVLKDQYGTSVVEVRVRDHAGNERVSTFPHTHLLRTYEWAVVGLILSVLAAGVVALRRLLKK